MNKTYRIGDPIPQDSTTANESKFTPYESIKSNEDFALVSNVISESEFRKRTRAVFNFVSNALTNTLGPYGSTTIIEQYGEMHITKDGFQVLKNIKFDNPIDNNILLLLLRISAQVVIKVGDGSTSSIVAANSILKEFEQIQDSLVDVRPKDLINLLNKCVKKVTEYIYDNAHKINKSTFDEIYKIAFVATNGDENISKIIQKIYQETDNPSIEYVQSKTDETTYEIITNGYKANITYIDTIFTNTDTGICEITNPALIMFNHKVDLDTSYPIIQDAMRLASSNNRRLVVIAPNYDQFLLEKIKNDTMAEYRIRGTSNIVYTRVGLVNNLSHELYNDFSVMAGGEIITEQIASDFNAEKLYDFMGEVDSIIINNKTTFIKGFSKRNINMYNKIVEDAESKYNALEEEYRNKGIIDTKLNEVKQRATKLKGSMGIISVGGYSTLEKKANYDLVEDAIKACESAYKHGYNVGGSLIIPYTIGNILSEVTDENERIIYKMMYNAFINVYKTVLRNKYATNDFDYESIINRCLFNELDELKCYNLITEEYSGDIINSCITDIEILKATVSIVSLLTSSNQYISILNKNEMNR